MGVPILFYTFYKKVIHMQETINPNEMKLYTALSTLSTIINYSCRMNKSVSRTKMRFVSYDKSTNITKISTFFT